MLLPLPACSPCSGYTAKVAGTEQGVTEPEATFSACFGSAFLMWHPVSWELPSVGGRSSRSSSTCTASSHEALQQRVSSSRGSAAAAAHGRRPRALLPPAHPLSPLLPCQQTKYASMLAQKVKKHGTHVWLINTGAPSAFPARLPPSPLPARSPTRSPARQCPPHTGLQGLQHVCAPARSSFPPREAPRLCQPNQRPAPLLSCCLLSSLCRPSSPSLPSKQAGPAARTAWATASSCATPGGWGPLAAAGGTWLPARGCRHAVWEGWVWLRGNARGSFLKCLPRGSGARTTPRRRRVDGAPRPPLVLAAAPSWMPSTLASWRRRATTTCPSSTCRCVPCCAALRRGLGLLGTTGAASDALGAAAAAAASPPLASPCSPPPPARSAGAPVGEQRALRGADAAELLGGQGELHQDADAPGGAVQQELQEVRGACRSLRCPA